MKKCFFFLSFCFLFLGCDNMIPKEELYKIEHNENTIIIQRIMGNATSANYIQIIVNGEKKLNIREGSIIVDNIVCNDSLFVVYKREWNTNKEKVIIDTLYLGSFHKGDKQ